MTTGMILTPAVNQGVRSKRDKTQVKFTLARQYTIQEICEV